MTRRIEMKRTLCSLALGLSACFATASAASAATNEAVRVISADLQHTNGPLNTMFKRCVGAGRANEGLRADWQRQLAIARHECGFEYIRFHGLFTDDMGFIGITTASPNTTGNTLTSCLTSCTASA